MNSRLLTKTNFSILVIALVALFTALVVMVDVPWLTVVKLGLLLVGFFILVQKPYFSLKAIIIFLPLLWSLGEISLINLGSLSINIPMLVGGVVFARYGYFLLVRHRDDKVLNILRILSIVYLLLGIPTILFSSSIVNGIGIYLRVYSPFIVLFAFYNYSTTKKLALANIQSFALAFFAILGSYLIGVINGDYLTTFGGLSRIRASYVPATAWGGYLSVMVGILLISSIFVLKKDKKRLVFLELAIVLAALFLTYNRTGWVGALIVITATAFLQKREKTSRILLLILFLGILINFNTFTNSLLRYSNEYSEFTSLNEILSGRTTVNSANLDYYLYKAPIENKLFGIGYYNSAIISAKYYGLGLIVHNDFLIVLVEQGIFSFLAYLSFVIFLIFIVIRDYLTCRSNPGAGFYRSHDWLDCDVCDHRVCRQFLWPDFECLVFVWHARNLPCLPQIHPGG